MEIKKLIPEEIIEDIKKHLEKFKTLYPEEVKIEPVITNDPEIVEVLG